MLALASCTQNPQSIVDQTLGLRLDKVTGDNQISIDVSTAFQNAVTVRLISNDGLPVAGVGVNFSLSAGTTAILRSPTAYTDRDGLASTVVIAPQDYHESFSVTAQAVGLSLVQTFGLRSPDELGLIRFKLSSTHDLVETAGQAFAFIVRAVNQDDSVDTSYSGVKTLEWTTLSSNSWLGEIPTLPSGQIACTFVAGVCYTPSTYVATDVLHETKIWVGMPQGVVGPVSVSAKPMTIVRAPASRIVVEDRPGGPLGLDGVLSTSDDAIAYQKIDLSTDAGDLSFLPAVTDAVGNYYNDSDPAAFQMTGSAAFLQPPYLEAVAGGYTLHPDRTGSGQIALTDLAPTAYAGIPVPTIVNPGVPAKIDAKVLEVGSTADPGTTVTPGIPFKIFASVQDAKGNLAERHFDTGFDDYSGVFATTFSLTNTQGTHDNARRYDFTPFGSPPAKCRGLFTVGSGAPNVYDHYATNACDSYSQSTQFLFGVGTFTVYGVVLDAEEGARKPILTISTATNGALPGVTGSVELSAPLGPPAIYAGFKNIDRDQVYCAAERYASAYDLPVMIPPFMDPMGNGVGACSMLESGDAAKTFEVGLLDAGGNFIDWMYFPDADISYQTQPTMASDLSHAQLNRPDGLGQVTAFTHTPRTFGQHYAVMAHANAAITGQNVTGNTNLLEVRAFTQPAPLAGYRIYAVQNNSITSTVNATDPFALAVVPVDLNGNMIHFSGTKTFTFTVTGPTNSPKGTAPTYPVNGTYTAAAGSAISVTLGGFSSLFYVPNLRFPSAGNGYSISVVDQNGKSSAVFNGITVAGPFNSVKLSTGANYTGTDISGQPVTVTTDHVLTYYANATDAELNILGTTANFVFSFTTLSNGTATLVPQGSSVALQPETVGTGRLNVTGTVSVGGVSTSYGASTGTYTIQIGTIRHLEVTTTNSGVETVGVPFGFNIVLADTRGNIVPYNATESLSWNFFAGTSWNGKTPTLPAATSPCTFVNGLCSTPTSYTLVNTASASRFWVNSADPTVTGISGQLISLVGGGVPAGLAFADRLGGPAMGAVSLNTVTGGKIYSATADAATTTFYGAVVDAGGNWVANPTGHAWTGGDPVTQAALLMNGDGSAAFSTTTATSSTVTLGKAGLTSDAVNVTISPGVPVRLSFQNPYPASPMIAGTKLTPDPKIAVEDAHGNLVTTASGAIQFGVKTGSGSVTGGTTIMPVSNGVATFSNMYLLTSGTYTFQGVGVSGTPLGLTSADSASTPAGTAPNSTVVNPGPPNMLVLVQPVDSVQSAGANFVSSSAGPIQVKIVDNLGNLIDDSTTAVSVILMNGGSATLNGTLTQTADHGIATFADLSITKSGIGFRLFFSTATGLDPKQTSAFSVQPNTPVKLSASTTPTNTVVNTCSAPLTVTAADVYDNPSNVSAPHTVNLAAAGVTFFTSATCAAGTEVTSASIPAGSASLTVYFKSVTVGTPTFTASDSSGLTSASRTLAIDPDVPVQLVWTTQPADVLAGGLISTRVAIEDQYGNVVTSSTGTITISLVGGAGVLNGTVSVAAVNGIALFANTINQYGLGYVLRASSSGLPNADSASFNVNYGAPAAFVFTSAPASATAGVTFNPAIVVEVRDSYGNVVTNNAWSLTLTAKVDGVAKALNGTVTRTAASGVATFSGVGINFAGSTVITASANGITQDSSAFVVAPNVPNKLSWSTQPVSGTAGTALAALSVQIQDTYGNASPTSGVTITLTPSASALTAGSTAVTDAGGLATFSSATMQTAGTYTLKATGTYTQTPASSSFVIAPAAATTSLAFSVQPAAGSSKDAGPQSLAVQLKDAYGNVQTNKAATPVTLSIASGGSFYGSTVTSANTSAGVATFNAAGVAEISVPGTYVVRASIAAPALSVDSNSFNVVPSSTSNQLVWVSAPSDALAGQAIPTMSLEMRDAYGNLRTNIAATNVTLTATPATSVTNGVVATSSGVVTYSATAINVANTYTLKATAANGAVSPVSASFTITAQAPTKLAFASPVTTVMAGNCTMYTLNSVDPYGNVSAVSAPHVLSLTGAADSAFYTTAGCAGGTTTTLTLAASTSSVVFYHRTLVSGSPTLTVSDADGLVSASQALTVNPNTSSGMKLVFSVSPPATGTAGVALTSFRVQMRDQYDNNITTNGATITLAIGTNPGGATLTGTSASTTLGAANFAATSLNRPGTGYTLTASLAGYTSVTSSTFDITYGAAAKLAYFAQPASLAAGAMLGGGNLKVLIQDSSGNTVANSTLSVTIAISTNPGAATLLGTTTVSAVAGEAVFTDLSIQKAATGYAIRASSGALTVATSSAFNVTAAASNGPQSSIAGTGPTLANNSATSTLTITLKDAYGNPVGGITPTVTVGGSGNTVSGCGATAAATGIATCTLKSSAEGSKTLGLSNPAIVPVSTPVQFYAATPCEGGICASATPAAPNNVYAWGTVTTTTTLTFAMKNVSSSPITVGAGSFAISGADAAFYAIQADNCSGNIVVAGGSCTVQVNFLATGATLGQSYNSANLVQTVAGGGTITRALSATRSTTP